MGQILHGTAIYALSVREKIQNSEESISLLASRYNINPKTAHKWKHRESVEDFKCGRPLGQGSVLPAMTVAYLLMLSSPHQGFTNTKQPWRLRGPRLPCGNHGNGQARPVSPRRGADFPHSAAHADAVWLDHKYLHKFPKEMA